MGHDRSSSISLGFRLGSVELGFGHMLSTHLCIPDDPLALPVGGKRSHLTARTWRDFAAYCGLSAPATRRIVRGLVARLDEGCDLVARSFLPDAQRVGYIKPLRERGDVLPQLAG